MSTLFVDTASKTRGTLPTLLEIPRAQLRRPSSSTPETCTQPERERTLCQHFGLNKSFASLFFLKVPSKEHSLVTNTAQVVAFSAEVVLSHEFVWACIDRSI